MGKMTRVSDPSPSWPSCYIVFLKKIKLDTDLHPCSLGKEARVTGAISIFSYCLDL